MKFLANENFPLKSCKYLESKGLDISSIGPDNPSVQDHAVMNIAISEDRTILTFDRDYGELIFKHNYRPRAGGHLFEIARIQSRGTGTDR